MRTLAIDLGTRRVGLAMSDEGGKFATPFEVLTISTPEQALEQIAQLIKKEGVQRVLLGLPLNMDDSIGPAARSSLLFGTQLAAKCGLAIVYIDERLSSFAAEQTLTARKKAGEKLTRQRKKAQLDAIAAAGFLQEFLDGRLPPLDEKWIASRMPRADNSSNGAGARPAASE